MEPTTGIEPVNLFLTKEVLYLLSYVGSESDTPPVTLYFKGSAGIALILERETGFEPATFSLEG
jgi:hypothetical protein